MDPVDDLIEELARAGRLDSRGEFTLDRDRAREKMRQFQLDDPRRYVLELVQAAVLKGASRIRFDIDADDMHMRFDGDAFTVEDFEHVYASMFTGHGNPRLQARRQLALGLNAAMALNPRHLRVHSGTAHMELRPGREDVIEVLQRRVGETRVHLKGRFRPGLMIDFLRNLRGTLAEELYLRDRCRHARVEIDLEGDVVSLGLSPPGVETELEILGYGIEGRAGFRAGAEDPGCIHLVTHGVWVSTVIEHELPPGFVAVVAADRLRKNLSQSDVVRDEAFEEVRQTVLATRAEALHQLWEQLPTWKNRDRDLLRWAERLVRRLSVAAGFEAMREGEPYARALAWPRVWKAHGGKRVSFDDCLAEIERRGRLAWSKKDMGVGLDDASFILLGRRKDLELFPHEVLDNVTRRLRRQAERAQAHAAWRKRKREPRLGGMGLVIGVPVEGDNIRGELGLRPSQDAFRLGLIVDGCWLTDLTLDVPELVGGVAMVEAPLSPNADLTGVHRNGAAVATVRAVVDAIWPLLLAAAGRAGDSRMWSPGRDRMVRVLAAVLDPLFPVRVLMSFGFSRKSASRAAPPGPVVEPEQVLEVPEAAALRALPLFRQHARSGPFRPAHVSLDDLVAQVQRGEPVRVLSESVPEIVAVDELVLSVSDEEELLLHRLFGTRVQSWDEEYRDRRARGRFLRQPARVPNLAFGRAAVDVQLGTVRGQITMPGRDEPMVGLGVEVELYRDARRLGVRAWELPVGPFVAVIEDPDLIPNDDWSDVVDEPRFDELHRLLARGAGQLLRHLVQDEQPWHMVRRLVLLRAMAVLWPWHGEAAADPLAQAMLEGAGGEGSAVPWAIRETITFAVVSDDPMFDPRISLAAVEAEARRRGRVTYVPMDTRAKPEDGEMVLRLVTGEPEILEQHLGPDRLVRGRGEVAPAPATGLKPLVRNRGREPATLPPPPPSPTAVEAPTEPADPPAAPGAPPSPPVALVVAQAERLLRTGLGRSTVEMNLGPVREAVVWSDPTVILSTRIDAVSRAERMEEEDVVVAAMLASLAGTAALGEVRARGPHLKLHRALLRAVKAAANQAGDR